MKPIACKVRFRNVWLALLVMCGMALTAPAHAQFGGWGGQQQLGTTLAIPMSDLGHVWGQNILHQNNVSFIAVTNRAAGDWNTQLAVVGITQRNTGGPAKKVWLKKASLPFVKQINNSTVIIENTAIGNGNDQTAVVTVDQSNYASVPAGTRYLFCPSWAAGPILQMNNNVVVVYNFAYGNGNTQLAVVGVTQSNTAKGLKVPKSAGNSLVQLNNNVTIVTNIAIGNNNDQTAVVSVDQNNRG